MEFLDEDARPRFVFQSRPLPSSSPDPQTHLHHSQAPHNKPLLFITTTLSSLLFLLSVLFLQTEPFKSLLLWLSLSLLLGPFAPSRLTGGRVRVGHGPVLEPLEELQPEETLPEKRGTKKRSKPIKSEEIVKDSVVSVEKKNGFLGIEKKSEVLGKSENGLVRNEGEREGEWKEEDVALLKKQMAKNPVGKPGRWEVIAEAFGGKFRVECVVKKAKELGERKPGDSDGQDDSYARFLKNRKPIDSRYLQGNEVVEGGDIAGESTNAGGGGGTGGEVGWNSGEDIALLNALKAFPKDAPMRWEKIAAAVPGKPKAACMKRVAELKKEFRNSKAAAEN